MNEHNVDPHLAKLAVEFASAINNFSKDYWHDDGESFRFTADGHTVEVSFAGVDIFGDGLGAGEELGWRIIADGVVVKEEEEEEEDEDEEDEGRGSAFHEAWLILSRLIRTAPETDESDREAMDLFQKVSLDVIQKARRASLI